MKCKRNLGFRTELLVDVVCVTCWANTFVMATHHLLVLIKFLENMEGKPQTNTEKREEKHKQQDQRAKSAEVKEEQTEPPTRTWTPRRNSDPMNNHWFYQGKNKALERHISQIWDPYSCCRWRGDACRDLGHSVLQPISAHSEWWSMWLELNEVLLVRQRPCILSLLV